MSTFKVYHLNKLFDNDSATKVAFVFLLFFLLVRVIAVYVGGQEATDFVDAKSYNGYAHAILQKHDWLTNPSYTGDYRPPVYPMLIAAVYSLFGINNFLAVYILQAFLSTLTCLYVFLFSQRVFHDNRAALLALFWSGIYVYFFFYAAQLLRETLIIFLFVAFLYYLFIYLGDENTKKRYLYISVVLYILLIHTDPRYIFYMPFLVFLFILYQPIRVGIMKYISFSILVLVLMAPWLVRNYIAYDALVVINTRCLDLRNKEERSLNMEAYKRGIFYFGPITVTSNPDYPTQDERDLIKAGLNPNNRSADEIKAIKNNKYPAKSYIARKWYNIVQLWKPFDFYRSYRPFPDARYNGTWSLKHNLASIVNYGVLLPFMLFGIYLLYKYRHKALILFTLPLVVHTILHVLEHGRNRYRVHIDTLIIILGCYGIVHFVLFILNWKKKGPT